MKRLLVASALFATGVAALSGVSLGHGGTYRGPGDTVPPGAAPPNPGTPGPSAPGPSTPGPSTPGPATPGPSTGGPATPGPSTGGPGAGPRTGAGLDLGPSLEKWQFWWEFNRNPFLNLKARIYRPVVVTGSDEFFLGRGDKSEAKDTLRPSDAVIKAKVVPVLLEELKSAKSREVLDSSMIALAKIGGDEAYVEPIAGFLKDSNQTLVETAAVSLGILAHPKALPTLKELVRDSAKGRALVGKNEVSYRIRAFATYGLGLLGFAVTDPAVKEEIAATLLEVISKDRSSLQDVRVAAVIAAGLVDDPEGRLVPALEELFRDRNADDLVRAHAPVAIAKIVLRGGAPDIQVARFVGEFTKALKEKRGDERVKESCVLALGQLTNPSSPHYADTLKLFEELQKDAPEQIRNFATIGLADAGGEEAAKILRRSLDRGKSSVKPWAGLGLGVLAHWEREAKRAVVAPEAILSELLKAMKEEANPEYAGAYALGLGLLGDPSAREPLSVKLETTSDEDARGYMCVGLGLLGAQESAELLRKEVKNGVNKPLLLQQAAIGLGLLSDQQAVPDLLNILKEANTLQSQSAVATALGFIGDQRSIDPLVAMAKDEKLTEFARGFAIVALGMVADKEPLPWNTKISVGVNYRAFTRTLVGAGFSPGVLDIL